MMNINDETIIGIDRRGQNIYMSDFKKNYAELWRCKKLTPAGQRLAKATRYYKNHEVRRPDFYKKIQEDKKYEE